MFRFGRFKCEANRIHLTVYICKYNNKIIFLSCMKIRQQYQQNFISLQVVIVIEELTERQLSHLDNDNNTLLASFKY